MAYPVSGQQPWGADLKAYIDDTDADLAAADADLAAADALLAAADAALAAADVALDDRLTTLEEDFQSDEALDADIAAFVQDEASLTWGALHEQFANRATQDTVNNGRLNDDVLTQRFAEPTKFISAGAMQAGAGSPSNIPLNTLVPCWRLDKATDESALGSTQVPKEWATFDIYAIGQNAAASTGNVVIRPTYSLAQDGEDTTITTSPSATTFAAAAVGIKQSIKVAEDVDVEWSDTVYVRILRDADNASDTLDNDWCLTGLLLVATAYVTFSPDDPEEPPPGLDGRAFTKEHNDFLDGLVVMHNALPPDSDIDDGVYKYYPGTDYSTMDSRYVDSASTDVDEWYFMWASRFNFGTAWNKKPGPLPSGPGGAPKHSNGRLCRETFTTRARAEAAVICKIRHILDKDDATVQAPWLAVGGVIGDLIPEQDIRDDPDAYCPTPWVQGSTTYQVMTDKVFLPISKLNDGVAPANHRGVLLDFEVQDDRTEAETTAHLTQVATELQAEGYELMLYLNTLTANGLTHEGLSEANLTTVLAAVDYMTLLLWAGNKDGSIPTSYDAMIDMLDPPLTSGEYAKLWPVFQLGTDSDTTIDDAEWLYDLLHAPGTDHPSRVMFWRSDNDPGGSPDRIYNKKISMVCFGTEYPPVP